MGEIDKQAKRPADEREYHIYESRARMSFVFPNVALAALLGAFFGWGIYNHLTGKSPLMKLAEVVPPSDEDIAKYPQAARLRDKKPEIITKPNPFYKSDKPMPASLAAVLRAQEIKEEERKAYEAERRRLEEEYKRKRKEAGSDSPPDPEEYKAHMFRRYRDFKAQFSIADLNRLTDDIVKSLKPSKVNPPLVFWSTIVGVVSIGLVFVSRASLSTVHRLTLLPQRRIRVTTMGPLWFTRSRVFPLDSVLPPMAVEGSDSGDLDFVIVDPDRPGRHFLFTVDTYSNRLANKDTQLDLLFENFAKYNRPHGKKLPGRERI